MPQAVHPQGAFGQRGRPRPCLSGSHTASGLLVHCLCPVSLCCSSPARELTALDGSSRPGALSEGPHGHVRPVWRPGQRRAELAHGRAGPESRWPALTAVREGPVPGLYVVSVGERGRAWCSRDVLFICLILSGPGVCCRLSPLLSPERCTQTSPSKSSFLMGKQLTSQSSCIYSLGPCSLHSR